MLAALQLPSAGMVSRSKHFPQAHEAGGDERLDCCHTDNQPINDRDQRQHFSRRMGDQRAETVDLLFPVRDIPKMKNSRDCGVRMKCCARSEKS